MPLTALKPSQELVDLVGALGGTWHGATAMCRCPAHADRTPSLSLRQGDTGILVTCFAGCDRENVLRQLRRIPLSGHHPAPPYESRADRAGIDRLWDAAGPADVSLPRRYLLSRGFDHVPADVRFHPRCPHGPKPNTLFKPALLVAVREGRRLVAFQRIFIDPETARYTAKLMLGRPGGGAWKGGNAGRSLALAEGFETAEAFALLNNQASWATLGARRLDQVVVPDTVEELIIAADSDAEGRRAAARACAHYARDGRTVRPAPPPSPFKDWADVLQARKRGGGRNE